VPAGVIVGGNPGKIIGKVEDLACKRIAEKRKIYTINDQIEEVELYYWKELKN